MNTLIDQYIHELDALKAVSNELIEDKRARYVIQDLIRIVENLATDSLLQKESTDNGKHV